MPLGSASRQSIGHAASPARHYADVCAMAASLRKPLETEDYVVRTPSDVIAAIQNRPASV